MPMLKMCMSPTSRRDGCSSQVGVFSSLNGKGIYCPNAAMSAGNIYTLNDVVWLSRKITVV